MVMDMWTIISGALGLGLVFMGSKLIVLKDALKELSDIPIAVKNALDDKNITKEELKNILAEVEEAFEAIKDIFNKKK